MKGKVIGIGAAGNKGTIRLMEKGFPRTSSLLINSTKSDINPDYMDRAFVFSKSKGGCGKERNVSKKLTLTALKENEISMLDQLIEPDDDMVIIVTSTEGGTGSGAVAIMAKYLKEVMGIHVHIFGFSGFEEDGRGLQNTIEFFQDLDEDYTVEIISNKKFLENTNNKLKAEELANEEFCRRVNILLGGLIKTSSQNIDHTDLFKATTTPGYMTIEYKSLDGVKNIDGFNKVVTEMIDNSKSLEIDEPSQKRLAVILNVKEKTKEFIDYQFSVIKERYGYPYEIFTHIQNEEDQEEFIAIISSGMDMPSEEVKKVYEKYKEQSEKVKKNKDSFFNFAGNLKGNDEDAMFNTNTEREIGVNNAKKSSFFNSYDETKEAKGFTNTVVKVVTKETQENNLKNNY